MSKSKRLRIKLTHNQKALGWLYLLFEFFVLPSLLGLLNDLLHTPLSDAALNFLYFSLNFVVVLLIFYNFLKESLETAGQRFWNFLQAVVLGFVAYWLCGTVLTYGITAVLPNFSNINDASIGSMAGSHFWLMAIGTVLLVPVVEECLFRGLIFLELHSHSRFWAYCLSTVCFGIIHVMSYVGAYDTLTLVLCFIQYIPAGIWLAWAYEKADSIFAPILIHAAINAIGIYGLR
ncbi:MAG: CPBP family intramembrane metalloprotease [Oscillospiraceae bacterium]|nr:CPBP family intramembrane metalloprotease [Oscillospiraceae bacterium]